MQPFLQFSRFPLYFLFLALLLLPTDAATPPKWEWKPPELMEKAEDEIVDLHCPARGRPSPLIRWSINAVPFHELSDDDRRILLDGGRLLRVLGLKRDQDTGLYQCNATNAMGHLAAATFLNVQAFAPRFRHAANRVWKVLHNAVVDLNCDVEAAPGALVRWVDANDSDIRPVSGKLEFLPNNTIRLHEVSNADDGFYYCNVSNKYGLNRAMNRLEVFKPTYFTKVPQPPTLTVDAFESLELQCRAMADPRLSVEYVWSRNGRPAEEQPQIASDGTSVLQLSQVRGRASGRIECAAVTDVDVKTAAMELLVRDVPEPPELLRIDCSSGRHALLVWRRPEEHGSALSAFTVDAAGENRAQQWEKVLEMDVTEQGSTASKDIYKTAIPLSPWVNYTFRLFAHNRHGASQPAFASFASPTSAQCTTPVDVPFQNPTNVRAQGTEPDNLVIHWQPLPRERWNAPGMRYLVRYRRADSQEDHDLPNGGWHEFYVEDPFANQTIVREQPTFRPYQIQVRAVNSKGFSAIEPQTILGWSGEDVPIEAPINLRVKEHINFSMVQLEWEPVSEGSVRGHFRGYRLDYWLSSRPFFVHSLFIANSSASALLPDLRAMHNYSAKVHVVNGQHESGPSNLLLFQTREGAPSKVHNLRVHAVGAHSLLVTWEPPLQTHGNLRGYFLAFENGSSGAVEETYVLHRQQFYLHEELAPNTPYRVGVWAETGGGEGPRLWRHTRTWPLRLPDPPLFLVRPGLTASALRVHWLPAGNGGANPHNNHHHHNHSATNSHWRMSGTSFALKFSKQSSPSDWTQSEWVTLPQTVLQLNGLDEGTDYWLVGMAREGSATEKSAASTPTISESKPMAMRTESSLAIPPFSQERLRSAAWFLAVLIAAALTLALVGAMCFVAQHSGGSPLAAIQMRDKQFGASFRGEDGGEDEELLDWMGGGGGRRYLLAGQTGNTNRSGGDIQEKEKALMMEK